MYNSMWMEIQSRQGCNVFFFLSFSFSFLNRVSTTSRLIEISPFPAIFTILSSNSDFISSLMINLWIEMRIRGNVMMMMMMMMEGRKFHSKNLLDVPIHFDSLRHSFICIYFCWQSVLFLYSYFYIKNNWILRRNILSINFSIGKLIRLGNAISLFMVF